MVETVWISNIKNYQYRVAEAFNLVQEDLKKIMGVIGPV